MTLKTHLKISRRAMIGGGLVGIASPTFASAPTVSSPPILRPLNLFTRTAPDVVNLLGRANLGGKVGFVVADASNGRILETMNPVLGRPPASVTKTITSQYALETLGPAHSFITRLIGTGPVKNGRLNGDLVLLGGGDPTLDTNALADMATALKATGLREIAGRFLVHAGHLPHIRQIDNSQPDYLGYNPSVSGLNLNYNRVHFEWKRSGDSFGVTMDARTKLYRPEISLSRMKIVQRDLPVYTYAKHGRTEQWTVANSSLGNGGSRWLPVRQPELYAGEVLQIFARSHGISLGRAEVSVAKIQGATLVSRQSPPLSRILKDMLKYSTNLTAEVTGLSASIERGLSPSSLASSAEEMSHWVASRLGTRNANFVDHSGLSDKNRISASDMVQVMLRTGPDSTLASLLKPIRVRDEFGKLVPNTTIQINAKTGTLNFVSALSGFIRISPNKNLAFATFMADMPRRAAIPTDDRERPQGGKAWNKRAHLLQWGLINRWLALYG